MKRFVLVLLIAVAVIGLRYWKPRDIEKTFLLTSAALTGSTVENRTIKQYPEVPREEILTDATASSQAVYRELQNRYRQALAEFRDAVVGAHAELVVVFLTPEVGNNKTPSNRIGEPYIARVCKELGIEFVDLSPAFAGVPNLTQMPRDGHWSRVGAVAVSDQLAPIIERHSAHPSSSSFASRPELLGDMDANMDTILDGGKNLPYRVQTNAQGLRIATDLSFPKKMQRVLLMGDSELYFPFLANPDTGTYLLQARFAEKEIVNTSMWGYSVDDQLRLFEDRAKYIEPDLVILSTNGGDILDFYFSSRNRFARDKKEYLPSATERDYYIEHFRPDTQKKS